jgi:hypothetical protein
MPKLSRVIELRWLAEGHGLLVEGEEYSIERLKQLLKENEARKFNESTEAVNKIGYQQGGLPWSEG